MSKLTELTEDQILLGQFYAWLHRRAEYLRQQKAAADVTGQDDSSTAAQDAESEASRQHHDATSPQVLQPEDDSNVDR